jgi:APA family basic amino acid/polyamine antiporter
MTEGTDLRRNLGLFPLSSIVVANMIGAGIFTTSGLLIRDLSDPVVMMALWIVGGLIALCGAVSYGVLGAHIPEAGGEYAFLSRLFHPLLGFLSGWTSFVVGFSAPIAASSIGFSEYLSRAFPALFDWGFLPGDSGIPHQAFAILLILIFTLIHMRGMELGARVQNYLTVMKVVLIVALVSAGFTLGQGDTSHFTQHEGFSFTFDGWKTIGLSLIWIMFAYSGWNASTYIGSEVRDPARQLPRSLVLGTGIVTLLYLALNAVFVYALTPAEMSGVISVGGKAMGAMFGQSLETIASLLISFALFSSLSAFVILGPRVYYAMARDGYFFRSVSYVHPRFGVPTRSIALQGLIAIAMVLSGTFDQILTFMGFALAIFPLFAVVGVFKLKGTGERKFSWFRTRISPLAYLFSGFSILVLAFLERTFESSFALLTVAAGIPLFFLFKRIQSKPEAQG